MAWTRASSRGFCLTSCRRQPPCHRILVPIVSGTEACNRVVPTVSGTETCNPELKFTETLEAIKPGRTDVKAINLSHLGLKVIKSCHKKQK